MNDISDQHEDLTDESALDEVRARREFLKKCGKYAVVVPPAMTLLLTRDANANGLPSSSIPCEIVPLQLCSTGPPVGPPQ